MHDGGEDDDDDDDDGDDDGLPLISERKNETFPYLNITWLALRVMKPEFEVWTSRNLFGVAVDRSSQPSI